MEFAKNESVNSSELRAGSRTYFFDVKETRSGEYYLTITESKKSKNGQDRNERHRIFLYREDMEAFLSHITEATNYTLTEQPILEEERKKFKNTRSDSDDMHTDINFDDL
ncbi:MAG: DUF3276 family protein [Mangrovibacterium sp.]